MVYYSDRLFEMDHEKHNALCMKHFGNKGQWWHKRSMEKIELFLRDYLGNDSIILKEVVQTENVATGYPVWEFYTK